MTTKASLGLTILALAIGGLMVFKSHGQTPSGVSPAAVPPATDGPTRPGSPSLTVLVASRVGVPMAHAPTTALAWQRPAAAVTPWIVGVPVVSAAGRVGRTLDPVVAARTSVVELPRRVSPVAVVVAPVDRTHPRVHLAP